MTKKYVRLPIPMEAWKNLKQKQKTMADTFREVTGKNKRIPLSNIVLAISKKPFWFDNSEIIKLSKRGRKI